MVVLILLVLGVRGCLNARNERAIKDYVADASSLIRESNQQSAAFFGVLEGGGEEAEPVDVENALNAFRAQSAQLVDRAEDLDVPGELEGAQDDLVEVLALRRDGLAKIADELPRALGDDDRREGTDAVAIEMQTLLASDVLYLRRFLPALQAALEQEGLAGELKIQRSEFVPDVQWLDPAFVADAVEGLRTGQGVDAEAAPGLHGTGIVGTSLGGVALTPGGSDTITLTDDVQFEIQIMNQGDNVETDIPVSVTVGSGSDAIELEEPLDEIAPGETQTVTIPLGEQPPTGQSVPITVKAEPVPGEGTTDNNEASYSAIFTR